MEQNEKSCFDLPNLAVIFDELRKGKHICAEDAEIYNSLQREYESFRDLFHYLGFDLVRHPRNFFYFQSELAFTDMASRVSVFMFILIEYLASEGRSIEEALTSDYIHIDALPHTANSRYKRYMDEAGVTVSKCINTLSRLGFIDYQGGNKFRFKSPVYRFIDLCITVLQNKSEGVALDGDSANDLTADDDWLSTFGEEDLKND